jgi:Xaa-Pro dipeptidase
MLTREGCRARQNRLLGEIEAAGWDLFLAGNPRTVYYLSGSYSAEDLPAAFLLWRDGSSVLFSTSTAQAFADRQVTIESYSLDRSITEPFHDAARLLAPELGRKPFRRCSVERGRTSGLFEARLNGATVDDATSVILRLRKKKEEDEIEEIRESLRYCAAAYRAAREAIAEGQTEIDMYLAMYAAVVREAGTSVPFPGDFACGQRSIAGGGPPASYRLQRGDLCVFDLFPAPHYYFGDTSRTFCVGPPDEKQVRAHETVREAIRTGERAVRPGKPARDVYAEVRGYLDSRPECGRSFWHHAGHGIGHHGHEAPRIIPGSEDIFEVGDVFTLEPGIYVPELGGGIRLEDNYVLRENGIENLFNFPMEL